MTMGDAHMADWRHGELLRCDAMLISLSLGSALDILKHLVSRKVSTDVCVAVCV